MSGKALINRVPKMFRKRTTFTGAAGAGAVGTVAVATVTGAVWLMAAASRCITLLTGAGTIEMGVSGDTAGILPQIADATNLDAGEWWEATPSAIAAVIVDKAVYGNIIITVGAANITAGVVETTFYYLPLSDDGYLG
jgi:hypothetical protein